ncbi:MAG: hypothetical protein RL407_708 [Bacteroidota bacterium]
MNLIWFRLFFSSLLLGSLPVLAQDSLPQQIQTYFTKYQEDFPVEKAYLHLDKFTYTLGEDLWFSAYLVAGGTQVPSPMSKTLYVDLFDGDGLLIAQKIVSLDQGRGAGDFKIPNFGKTGTYQLKAYTAWMKNFGEAYFFSQKVSIVDAFGGSFLPKVEVNSITVAEGKIQYQVSILAVSSSGEALSNGKIDLQAIAGEEILHSQSLQLNALGETSISFAIPDRPHPSQHLALSFEEQPGYVLTHNIKLPYALHTADIQFLPEGGNWIIGKKSKLAIRAIYPDGSPVVLTGNLEGEPSATFSTNQAGLGKIEFIPQREAYTALVVEPTYGEKRSISIQKAMSSGITIQVQQGEESNYIAAMVQGVNVEGNLLLVSHTRGLINYMIQGKLFNGVWGLRIPKKNLPSGINTLSVLDESGRTLLERLVFVHGPDQLQLTLTSLSESLSPRSKVSLTLASKFQDSTSLASLSVSVVDAAQVQDESEIYGTIQSHLLLSSDLKGTVFRPGYYFQNQSPIIKEELDWVMLTHGWTRFTWKDVFNNVYPDQGHYIEQGITVQGTITEKYPTKKGLGGGKITALVGEGVELLSTEYGPDGSFLLTDLNYQDSTSLTLTAEDSRAKNFIDLSLRVQKPHFKMLEGSYPKDVFWPKELIASVEERRLMQQLSSGEEVTDLEGITIEANTLQEEQTQSRKLYGPGDATLKPEEIPGGEGYTNIFQMIQGRVAGVRVNFNGISASVQIRGVGSIQAGTEPLYLLDNVPVDASTISLISPRNVESVEVFKDPSRTAIFGSQGGNGVIAVYTKTGAGLSYTSDGGTLVTRYSGYAIPKVFYSPKYDEKSPSTTDRRATLFWSPLVQTDATGKASLEYFNSDTATTHVVVVEGIDKQGRLGRLVTRLQ